MPISRYVLFFSLALSGVTLDLVSKSMIFARYFDPARSGEPQDVHWLVDGILGIQTSTNPGALFGIGHGYSWLFAIFSVIAIVGILVWLFVARAAHDRWLTLTLGLITGGILGNLYDRVGLGALPEYPESIRTNVRDFILFRIENVPLFDPWPNFNIADSLLVTGAALLFVHALFMIEPPAESAKDTSVPS